MTKPTSDHKANGLSRRAVLKTSAATAYLSLSACGGGRGTANNTTGAATPPALAPNNGELFLTDAELQTLQALVEAIIPEDIDPGAATSGCAQAINNLLSAFAFDPPMIFAGGPYSDRGGAQDNDFQQFIPLDAYEERAWRLKIEGSQGLTEREFNGTRKGWQAIYRDGLARLNERAAEFGFSRFANMPGPTQELLLRDSSDGLIADLVDIAVPQTIDAMYGAPEYGGNQNLAGWAFTAYDGDVQPRGYTDEQVTTPDNPGLADLLPLPIRRKRVDELPSAGLLPVPDARQQVIIANAFADLMAMSSPELALSAILNSESRLSRLQTEVNKHRPSQAKLSQAKSEDHS